MPVSLMAGPRTLNEPPRDVIPGLRLWTRPRLLLGGRPGRGPQAPSQAESRWGPSWGQAPPGCGHGHRRSSLGRATHRVAVSRLPLAVPGPATPSQKSTGSDSESK